MKKLITRALAVGGLVGCGGGAMITSHILSESSTTGDGWYVRNARADYYCDGKTNTCKAAEMK